MSRPAYQQLYEKLRQEIISGVLPFGSRLPGKRALAEQYHLSVITVAHALDLLAEEGYVSLRERSGCFVSFQISDPFLGSEPSESVLPSPSETPSSADVEGFPFSVLARTIRRVLAENAGNILLKTPGQGLLPLRQAISRYLARARGIWAEPEQIFLGAGAEYLYGLLAELLGRDRIWAIESPSYEKIRQVYAARNIRLEYLPLGSDGLLSAPLWQSEASVLHVSPYRSFPSDVTATASKRAEYLRWAEQKDRFLIEDDYESEFSVQQRPMETLYSQSSRACVIYLNTFSRTISSALRAGYMVLPTDLLPLCRERIGFYSCTVPAFEQYVLTDLLDSGDFERHIRRVRRRLRETRV